MKLKHIRPASKATQLPFRIRSLGQIKNQPNHSTLGTYHQDIMLTCFTGGSGTYQGRRGTTLLTPGVIGLIPPQKNPGIIMANPNDPYTHYYCRFSGDEAHRIARRILEKKEHQSFFKWPRWPEIERIFQQMMTHRHHSKTRLQSIETLHPEECLLSYLLTLLEQSLNKKIRAKSLSRDALMLYLNDHISEPLDLNKIANYFSVSKAHLCRVAHKELENTLLQTAERIKIEYAKTLLRDRFFNLSISEIAQKTGYQDPLYFSKAFKKRTGLSPKHWRNSHARK